MPEGDALRVTSFERIRTPTSTIQSALIGATPFAARSFAFVLVDIGGGITQVRWDNTMNDLTETFVMGRLTNDDDSLRNYYLGDSYQMQDITAKVIGPLSYTLAAAATPARWRRRSRRWSTRRAGPFQHYLWYFGSQNAAVQLERPGVGRHAGEAVAATPGTTHSTSCVVLVQEPGHNFGMQHSSSLECGTSVVRRRPERLHRQRVRRLLRSDGRRLPPHERLAEGVPGLVRRLQRRARHEQRDVHAAAVRDGCDGAQFLQIKAPKARPFMRPAAGGGGATTENLDYYYLELRTPVDFDGTLGNGSALSAARARSHGGRPAPRTGRGLHTFLLDMNAVDDARFNDAALAVGQTFTDPAGGLSHHGQRSAQRGRDDQS